MKKKRFAIKDKRLRSVIRTSEKKILKRNFFELLRRAARTISDS